MEIVSGFTKAKRSLDSVEEMDNKKTVKAGHRAKNKTLEVYDIQN